MRTRKPRIEIKKWYQQPCIACKNLNHEFGDYDTTGYFTCDREEKLENLKCFPYMEAKKCKSFEASCLSEWDGWGYLDDFEKVFKKDCYEKLNIFLDFKKRMGDYKIGRIR